MATNSTSSSLYIHLYTLITRQKHKLNEVVKLRWQLVKLSLDLFCYSPSPWPSLRQRADRCARIWTWAWALGLVLDLAWAVGVAARHRRLALDPGQLQVPDLGLHPLLDLDPALHLVPVLGPEQVPLPDPGPGPLLGLEGLEQVRVQDRLRVLVQVQA